MSDFLDNHAAKGQDHLDERETPPTTTDVCPVCQRSLTAEPTKLRTLFRCQDCPMGRMMCHSCVLRDHHSRPFDRIRRWSPEDECWDKVSTADLGHVVYLGRLVILDAEDSWAPDLVRDGIVEKFYVTDLSDQDHVFDNCMASIRRAERVGLALLL